MPMLFGYLNVRVDAPRGAQEHGERVVREYAWREGYSLGTVFVEWNHNRPLSALMSLIEAANRDDVRVVAVPTPSDLGSLPSVRRLTRHVLMREANVHVIVVRASK